MKPSHLVSALVLLAVLIPLTSYALSMPNLAAQVTGTVSIIIGGSASTTSTTGGGGGGGGGGGNGGSTTTGSTTTMSMATSTFSTLNGNTTLTSSANVSEFRNGPILMISVIALALVISRSSKLVRIRAKLRDG